MSAATAGIAEHERVVLEFDRIRKMLVDLSLSPAGGRLLLDQEIITEEARLQALRVLVAAFLELLRENTASLPPTFPDIGDLFGALSLKGSVLELEALHRLACFLESAAKFGAFMRASSDELLLSKASGLPDCSQLCGYLRSMIDREGKLREKEIPELQAIRSRINTLRRGLDQSARTFLGDQSFQGYWKSAVPSEKDGRMVLPLDANFKGRIPGIVYESSSRGMVLFFEPLEIFEKNNELAQALQQYQAEVFRILKRMSARAVEQAPALVDLHDSIAWLDSLLARARLGYTWRGGFARIENAAPRLVNARHPLLRAETVVPVTIELEKPVLVVSGPNTGGKTVALKTLGLFVLLNQFALPIPADSGSTLPLFAGVYADIGDEQSLDASLSTFSAHVRNLGRILTAADDHSLVLLDEFGSGTDPQQGASLGMAILDELLKRNCTTVVTTHLSALKEYALATEGAQNASVLFDEDTHSPLYRLVSGIPGSSRALEIAARYGMPTQVLTQARAYLEASQTEAGRALERAQEMEQEAQEKLQRAENAMRELEAFRQKLSEGQAQVKARERELKAEGLREVRNLLAAMRREHEQVVRDIREQKASPASIAAAKNLSGSLQEQEAALESELREPEQEGEPASLQIDAAIPLAPGLEVCILSNGRTGVLEHKTRKGWVLRTGSVKLTLPEQDFRPLRQAKASAQVRWTEELEPASHVSMSLDLRGMRLADARLAVEQYLDKAILQGLKECSIIHGMGNGVLQQAVHDYLKQCPAVRSFGWAHPDAGGFGKTIVEL